MAVLTRPLRVYVGWDKRDALAFEVCRRSLVARASAPVEAIALKDWELRARGLYWRTYWVNPRGQMFDDVDQCPFSTDFTYSRFLVPALEGFASAPVVYCDADMLWRGDVHELVALLPAGGAAALVKHDHRPPEAIKITDSVQRPYRRKNWSSLMVLRPSACRLLSPYQVNRAGRDWLHGIGWLDEAAVVALPEAWNWLEGWSSPTLAPKLVHYTRGTPDHDGLADAAYAEEWWSYADAATSGRRSGPSIQSKGTE